MRKLLLLCAMLLSGIGAWADFEQTYGGSTPWVKEGFVAPVSARNGSWSIGMTQIPVTASAGNVTVTFDWNGSANCGLNILGVDLVDPETYEVVAYEYKTGKDSWTSRPEYALNNVENGNYILRYFVEEDGNDDAFSKTGGKVRVVGADYYSTKPMSGFYRIKGQNSTKQYLASTIKNERDLEVVATVAEAGIYYVETSGDNIHLLNYETGKYLCQVGDSYFSLCDDISATNKRYAIQFSSDQRTYNNVGDMPQYKIYVDWQSDKKIYMFNNNSDGIVHQGADNAADEKFFTFEPVYQLPKTIGDAQWSTLYSPVVLALPAGVDAYYVSKVASSYVSMTKIEGGVVPANTAVILNGVADTYDLNISGRPSEISGNELVGTIANTYVADPAYVLAKPIIDGIQQEVGLYKAALNKDANGATGTTHFKNNAGKAYLPASAVPSAARFLVFSFGDDMETGITETENGNVKMENAEVYDLAGRRVQGAQKGIFIVNGKKVVR